MIEKIVYYTDPILREPCVEIPPKNTYWDLWANLWDTLRYHKGLGLAAPQIGKRWRAFMVDGQLCINPITTSKSNSTAFEEEGCLSIPNTQVIVERSTWIRGEYIGRSGDKITWKLAGLKARVWQHEMDHLDGILITDYQTQK
jgi:peptide deformylase